jgi:hypothetical protein
MRRSLLTLLLLVSTAAFAQTTGSIGGRVSDSSGGAVPGVTVEAKSSAMQGTRIVLTDPTGAYHLLLLPPGDYAVAFRLEGFAAETRRAIPVSLDKATTLDITLKPSASAEITVSSEAPVVDTSSPSLGTNLNTRAIETLPTARNYSSIAQVVPGVSSDADSRNNPGQTTISVYGSSGAENAFFIDGMNTTNVEYGFQGKELNFEFIRELDVKTGGYEAEYGRSTGGIINVITKSGGNEFTGDVFGYYDKDSLQANAKEVVSTAGTPKGFTRDDYGADLGGFILRDKLWFFAAYDRVTNSNDTALLVGPQAGQTVRSNSRRNLGSAKLTYNIAPSQSFVFTFLQDPRVDAGAINDPDHTLNGDPSTYLGRQDFGGRDYALRYDGGIASNWILSGQAARHQEKNSIGPATSVGDGIEYREVSKDFFQTGGFGLIQAKDFDRKHVGGSLEKFFFGNDLKGGIEFEREAADVIKRMSGGQRVDVYGNDVNPSKPIYRHFYWTTPDATVENAPVSALLSSTEHKITTLYLQDRWSMQNFTLNAGVRWDRQQIIGATGVTQIDLKKDYAPRLGFVWDPTGAHKGKLFGSYGRFYEEIPMDLVIRSFSFERQPRIFNYSPISTTPDPNAESDLGKTSTILGGATEPVDPNLKNQYLNEYLLGFEHEVLPNLAVGVKGIYRSYGRVIEDFLCSTADGTYCIGNPGQGIMREIFTYDYSTSYPAPKPKRTFKGVQLDATKRFSDNWQAMASYLYSKLDGNFDGEVAPFTNVGADPNISAAYDYYDFFTNGSDLSKITNRGPLSNDRRNQFKVSGVYNTLWNLSFGLSAYWRSGTPLTRYGYSDGYGRYEFFLTTRGAEGRTPSNYDADVHLGYPIGLGRARLNLLLDVFNILNAQRPVLLDQRWGFQESDNASPTPVNPGYLKPVLRTAPTSARLGLRLTF